MKLFGKKDPPARTYDVDSPIDIGTIMLTTTPFETSKRECEMHEQHRPRPTYSEIHHIIPRAWQYAWHPGDPPIEADETKPRLGRTTLFDPRTMALCPTGHRNVHFWLAKLMHEWERSAAGGDPVLEAAVASVCRWAAHSHTPLSHRALNTAELAMKRWVEAGGSLTQLVKAGLYGQV